MEFIQKKSQDSAVGPFLLKAADEGVALVWDRYEGQLPECGFCEAGMSCRDCLQGPCISHPFKGEINKSGICGKDNDTLAAHSLLRLALKGTMGYLDQLNDLLEDLEKGNIEPADKAQTEKLVSRARDLYRVAGSEVIDAFPETMSENWRTSGVVPQGVARDVIKASQKLEGGIADLNELVLWSFKCSLLGAVAQRAAIALKKAVFGDVTPTELCLNLGCLAEEKPTVLFFGNVPTALISKVCSQAESENIEVGGVCTDTLISSYKISPVTNYGSQEVALMTGAVDVIVVGDQFVNPSLSEFAERWEVKIIKAQSIKGLGSYDVEASSIIETAKRAFDTRSNVKKTIPAAKDSALMGYTSGQIDAGKIIKALDEGKIKGVALLCGSNNVKYSQDNETVVMAEHFLENDILCFADGEASITLAKKGFLKAGEKGVCGDGLSGLLTDLGDDTPAIIDITCYGVTDLLIDLAGAAGKALSEYPVFACYPEANRTMEVTKALWTVAMGVPVYFWPALPVTGSAKMVTALSEFCTETFGAGFNIIARKRLTALVKAGNIVQEMTGGEKKKMSGYEWR